MAQQRIVVGTDGSEVSRTALRFAADEARRRDAELVVVRVWETDPLTIAPGAPIGVPADQAERAALHEIDEDLHTVDLGGLEVTRLTPSGRPEQMLEALADGADLLVVGTHGRGLVGRLVLGSVSRHVIANAPCPVAVVPLPRTAAAPTPTGAPGRTGVTA